MFCTLACKYALPVRLASLGVSCRLEHDLPRYFIPITNFACLRSSLCAIADPFTWRFVLRNGTFRCLLAPSVDNNRYVVLLPMQPHFCECLLHSWRCWLAVFGLTVHFNFSGYVPKVNLFFSHSRCVFMWLEFNLFHSVSFSVPQTLVCLFLWLSVCFSLSLHPCAHVSMYL